MNLDFRATDDTSKKAEYFPVSDEVKSCYIVGTSCLCNKHLFFMIDDEAKQLSVFAPGKPLPSLIIWVEQLNVTPLKGRLLDLPEINRQGLK